MIGLQRRDRAVEIGAGAVTPAVGALLSVLAKLSGAKALEALTGTDMAAERVKFLYDHHIVDIVRQFPVKGVDAEALLIGLRPLQPRLYSLASSQALVGDEAHLTVAPVRYGLHGTGRGGIASTQSTQILLY